MSLTGHAKIAGIVGWPVGHSLSPRLHGYWIAEHKLDAAYIPIPVRGEDFAATVVLLPKLGFRGLNVTIPHKEAAFALATEHDESAKTTGAVNTLVFEDGRIIGKNTDVAGVIGMLRDAGIASLKGETAVVYGAGGAARAVVFALITLGVAQVWIANRTVERAQDLAKRFDGRDGARVNALVPLTWNNLGGPRLIVNTTSVGMEGGVDPGGTPRPPLGWSGTLDVRTATHFVDLVYRPLETAFLREARVEGSKTIDGLGMLLHQAVPAFHAWFGIEPKVTPALRAHMLEALKD